MRRKAIIILLLWLTIGPSANSFADQEAPPYEYAVISEDGKHIFVMLIPGESLPYRVYLFNSEKSISHYRTMVRNALFLRRKFPCSGLYKADGSTTPLWTVIWYAFRVYLDSDPQYLVRVGPWPSILHDGWPLKILAYSFYKNGVEVAHFNVEDIVKNTDELEYSVSHYIWDKQMSFDRENGVFNVTTVDSSTYHYEIREIAHATRGQETACTPNSQFVEYSNRLKILPFGLAIIMMSSLIVMVWIIKQMPPATNS